MRIYRILLVAGALALFGGSSFAERVSLVFDKIGIVELAKKPVIFTSEAVKAQETVSLTLKNVEREQALEPVGELLRRAGYSAESRAGVVWIDKAAPADADEVFYRPKYRSASYLLDMLTSLFKPGAFSLQHSSQPEQSSLPFPATSTPSAFPDANVAPLLGAPQQSSGPPWGNGGGSPWGNGQATAQAPWLADNGMVSSARQGPDAFIFRGTLQEQQKL